MMISDADWEIINLIPGWMSRDECDWLAKLANSVSSWTELGTFNGRSMLAVGLYIQQFSWLQVVDVAFADQFWIIFKYLHSRRPDIRLVAAECCSGYAYQSLTGTDVVFIDADHEYKGISEDIDLWKNKCRHLCGHDFDNIDCPAVTLAVNQRYKRPHRPVGMIWYVDMGNEDDYK